MAESQVVKQDFTTKVVKVAYLPEENAVNVWLLVINLSLEMVKETHPSNLTVV